MFFKKKKEYKELEVIAHPIARELLEQNHCLIAGCTGSGKSTVLDLILYNLCIYRRCDKSYVIIDLKRVSLIKWEFAPHCLGYARTMEKAVKAIRDFVAMMDQRFKEMEKERVTMYDGGDAYLVIDEAADLLAGYGANKALSAEITALLVKIARLGRAAKCHLIFATQQASRKVILSDIQANCNALLGLHCRSALESRQIIGYSGCEALPRYGNGLLVTPDYEAPQLVTLPMVADEDINKLLGFYKAEKIEPPKNPYWG